MTLKQLQAEWRPKQADRKYWTGDDHTQNIRADALTPFILQQERDARLIRELYEAVRDSGWNPNDWVLDEARSRLKEME